MADFIELILEAFNITPGEKKTKAGKIAAYVLILLFVILAIVSLFI